MSDIVSIGLAAPNDEVIRSAEEILARARSGELRGLIWIADAGPNGWLSSFVCQRDHMAALGQLARLQHRIQCDMDNNAVPSHGP